MIDRYIVVDVVSSRTESEFLRSFLQAKGVRCELSQEALGQVYGLEVGTLGRVEILVPSQQGKKARAVLREFHNTKRESKHPPTKHKLSKRAKDPKYLMRLAGAGICILCSLLSIYLAVFNLDMAGGRGGLIVLSLIFLVFAASLLRNPRSAGR